MRVIATGATSFVGQAAVRELLRRGHEVTAVVRPGTDKLGRLAEKGVFAPGLQILELDLPEIGRLPEIAAGRGMNKGFAGGKGPDAFLHMGWLGAGSDSRRNPDVQKRSADIAFDAMRAAAALGAGRFLFTGSQAEYGIRKELTDEEAPCLPTSPYGEAKLRVREEGEKLCRELGMDYLHARIFSAYGPGDHPWSLISSCVRTFREGGVMEMTDCTQLWNFLYIDDAGRALADLLEAEGLPAGGNPVYNLGGSMEETAPLKEFVLKLWEAMGRSGELRFGARGANAEGIVNLVPDIRKMEREVSWKPEIPFEEGIRRILRTGGKTKENARGN